MVKSREVTDAERVEIAERKAFGVRRRQRTAEYRRLIRETTPKPLEEQREARRQAMAKASEDERVDIAEQGRLNKERQQQERRYEQRQALEAETVQPLANASSYDTPSSAMVLSKSGDEEAMGDAVAILSNAPATGIPAAPAHYVGKSENGDWLVGIAPGLPGETLVHELGHVRSTDLDAAMKANFDRVAKNIWNAIEDARIDRQEGEWFDKPIWQVHREMLQSELATSGPGITPGDPRYAKATDLILGVLSQVFELDLSKSKHEDVRNTLTAYHQDIAHAVASDSSDESIAVALKIARYYRLEEAATKQEKADKQEAKRSAKKEANEDQRDNGEGVGSPDDAKDEGEKGERGTSADEGDDEGKPEEPNEGADGDSKPGDEPASAGAGQEPEPSPEEQDGESPDSPESPEEARDDEVDKAAERQRDRKEAAERASSDDEARVQQHVKELGDRKDKARQFSNRYSYGAAINPKHPEFSHHEVQLLTHPGYSQPAKQGEQLRVFLEGMPSPIGIPNRSRVGVPTSHAWKLNIGELRVFERRPKQKGRLVVLVDMSGSMGCHCEHCKSPKGYVAWQAALAVSARQPEAEVFGFTSSESTNFIFAIPKGYEPIHTAAWHSIEGKRIGYGNADCTALMWLREHVEGDIANTTCVIISDGHPGHTYPIRCDAIAHARRVAHQMRSEGLRYLSILIDRHDTYDIYPSECRVMLMDDKDIPLLEEPLRFLEQR
jgi:hypothetical protein